MNVKILIEFLQKMPPDATAAITYDDGYVVSEIAYIRFDPARGAVLLGSKSDDDGDGT